MELRTILTEAELAQIPEAVAAKIESAYCAELATAIQAENEKTTAKFNNLVEMVNQKVEDKVNAAVTESVNKMGNDAINNKMFNVLQNIAAVLESAGIPTTEVTKRLKEELAQCNINLKKAYQDREHVKKELNEQYKIVRIHELTKGCSPDVIDAAIQHFRHCDIREIDKDTISKFIDGDVTGESTFMLDVDPEAGGELNLDRVNASLREIDEDFELDVPSFPTRTGGPSKKGASRYESIGHGLRPQRVKTPASTATLEALEQPMQNMDEDVAEAMEQVQAYGALGIGGRFA